MFSSVFRTFLGFPSSLTLIACGFCPGLIVPAAAQVLESARASLDPSGAQVWEATFAFQPQHAPGRLVTGASFSAEETLETHRQLPDGKRVDQSLARGKVFRDARGRMRWERVLDAGPDLAGALMIVEIDDVVGGYHYTLDMQNMIAHRARLLQPGEEPVVAPVSPPARGVTAIAAPDGSTSVVDEKPEAARSPTATEGSRNNGPRVATAVLPRGASAGPGALIEELPVRMIDGIPAAGKRFTTAVVGVGLGGRRIFTTAEEWTSTELGVVILSRFVDASGSERIMRLVRIQRAEPEASLFTVPSNYVVKDDAGEFRISFVIRK